MSGEAEGLGEALRELRKALRKQVLPLERAGKALDALVGARALEELGVLDGGLPALREADLGALGLGEQQGAVVRQLEAIHGRLVGQARMALLGGLRAAAESEGLGMALVGERPLVVALAPVEVEIDVGGGAAVVRYAREVVEECAAEAGAIVEARGAAMKKIREAALPSEVFFERLVRAYRMVLAAQGEAPGERVDLVDLLAPLALLGAGSWRKKALGKIEEVPKYMLAYQLQRLRREGMLARDGLRVELGVATGGSARDKRNVVYVPAGGEGQYQLSLRVVGT